MISDNYIYNAVKNVINNYDEIFTDEDLFILDCICRIFNDADFERKHPRDEQGRFTSGRRRSKEYISTFEKLTKDNLRDWTTDEIIQRAVETYSKKYPIMTVANIKSAIAKADAHNEKIKNTKGDTQNKYSVYDKKKKERIYNDERAKKHQEILEDIFANKEKARPKNGEKPKAIFLGGRGGSGKSKFGMPDEKSPSNLGIYDESNFIVLDADKIKKYFDEYEGYNAFEVHEESSDVLTKALEKAQEEKLNVVLDATMKTAKSTEKKIKPFIEADYDIEMYYMHLPREKAAERAVHRFMTGKEHRYVPLNVILEEMKENEEAFDELKKYATKWAFYNNDVPTKDDSPILIDKNF